MEALPDQRRALLLSWCQGEHSGKPHQCHGTWQDQALKDGKTPLTANSQSMWCMLIAEIESCSSSGDWDGLQTCYKIIKRSLGGDGEHVDALICSLHLLDGCLRVIGANQSGEGMRESIVVGALLASGISLSSCASNKSLASRVCLEGYLKNLVEKFERSIQLFVASGMPSSWEQYGMTLFKSMSKTALGFLTHGMEEECYMISDRVIVRLVAHCRTVVPNGLKSLSAMSQHVSNKASWVGLLARALDAGSIENLSSNDIIELERCLSCCRRLLLDVIDAGDHAWATCQARFTIYTRMLSSVDFLYSTCGHKDLHCGLVAVGIIGRSMCLGAGFGPDDSTSLCEALCKTLINLLGFGSQNNDVPSTEQRVVFLNHMKDLQWLARSLYTSGVSESNVPDMMRYAMLWGSAMCSILALFCSQDEKAANDLIQYICRFSRVSIFSGSLGNGDTYTIHRKAVYCLWDTGHQEYVSILLSTLVKSAYSDTIDHFRMSEFVSSFLPDIKKKRIDKALWLDVLKFSIASMSTLVEARPELSFKLEEEVNHIFGLVRVHFNPGKSPDAFLDVLLACHRHSTAFPALFSADQFTQNVQAILDETTTKIGHKRIEEVKSIIEILRIEDSVSALLGQSHEYHREVAEKRREMLLKDPTVIHSEGWVYSDCQQQIEHMLENQDSWKAIISKSSESLEHARCASTISCSTSIIEQVEVLVNLHRPGTFAPGDFSFWDVIAHPNVDEDFNLEKSLMCIAENSYKKNACELSRLNMYISKNQAVRGHINSALFHAIEWHKHVSPTVNNLAGDTFNDAMTACWWTSASEYLACCSWLGFLFSVTGLYEESTQAYYEGLKLACLLGSPSACLLFTVSLAEVHMMGGDAARFQAMLNQAIVIEHSMEHVDECHTSISCILAHLEVLRARTDRDILEFGKAKSRISAACRLLADIDSHVWYRARVLAATEFEHVLVLLEEESYVSPRDIELCIEKLRCWMYDRLMLGAPLSLLFVLQAQTLAQSYFEQNKSRDASIWVSEKTQNYENRALIKSLWSILLKLRCSPFCQKTVFLLLAPVCASVGCKYAAIALLHAASNPTLEFQQDLVSYTKAILSALKSSKLDQLPSEHSSLGGVFRDQMYHSDSPEWEIEQIEHKAERLVSSWTENLDKIVICGVAVYNSSVYGPSKVNDKLVIFRLRNGQVPLMVEIPSPEIDSCHPIHQLHGKKSCGAIELLENKLQDILKRSNSNMRSIMPTSSEVEQRSWWEERIELDHSMQQLLQELHSEWIGAWKCLFMDAEDGKGSLQDEVELLTALLSHDKATISKDGMEALSRIIHVARHGTDIERIEKFSLSNAFEELHIGEGRTPKANLNRKVSFTASCRGDVSDSLHCSPDEVAVLRSEVEDVSRDIASFHLSETDVGNPADTPAIPDGTAPSQAKSVSRRKHKSRLPQMHSLMTPNPRKAFGSRNFSNEPFQTPKTSLKQPRDAGVTPLLDKTRTMPPLNRKRPGMEASENKQSVVLILDHAIHSLPWESSFRMLSGTKWEFYRIPSLPAFTATAARKQTISVDSCYYAINPGGDLVSTQKKFEEWFKRLKGWRGRAGSPPNASELSKALQECDLFVYCGHGGGEQYLPSSRLRSLESCASSLLMGCSSGKLKRNNGGVFEASGVILAYTLAGCPAVVGNLWDVTDKDIDRYCHEMISKMISSASHNGKTSIGHVVQNSRQACKLPFLIGAAPVCYGIPATFT